MHFMNHCEIDEACYRHAQDPVLRRASKFLADFRDLIDSCSDGWCSWAPPVRAAHKLMTMLENPPVGARQPVATGAAFLKALTPIKSFCTRHKLKMPEIG
jgi:hypothetical protein